MHSSSTNATAAQQPNGVIAQGIELGGTAGCLGASGYLLLYLVEHRFTYEQRRCGS